MSKIISRQVDLSALAGLAPELAELMVAVACDIALVLDDGGVIRSVALGGGADAQSEGRSEWVGRRWTDVVTTETRGRAEQFLDDLAVDGVSRLRHLSHSSEAGAEIPMTYTAVKLGEQGLALAVGRDMRLVSAMQERLTSAQRDIERDYWVRRQAETRYRLLFQVAAEPMLIVEAHSYNVIDANRAAEKILGCSGREAYGQPLSNYFAPFATGKLHKLLDSAYGAERVVMDQTRLQNGVAVDITIAPFQTESASVLCLILRESSALAVQDRAAADDPVPGDERFARLCELTGDAVAICDLEGAIVFVNEAFTEMVQSSRNEVLVGRRISRWIESGEGGTVDVLSLAKKVGVIRLLQTTLRRSNGSRIDVELSATVLKDLDGVGMIIRVCHAQRTDSVVSDCSEQNGIH